MLDAKRTIGFTILAILGHEGGSLLMGVTEYNTLQRYCPRTSVTVKILHSVHSHLNVRYREGIEL